MAKENLTKLAYLIKRNSIFATKFEEMEKQIFIYNTNCVTHASIATILQNIIQKANEQNWKKFTIHSIQLVMSEILSNIASHACLKSDEFRSISVSMAITDEGTIHIHTHNFIPNAGIEPFHNTLEKINHLGQHELKELQQKTLQEHLDNPGSPHIGLIMIRRKTCKPIVYKFEPYNNEISYISLDIELDVNGNDELKKSRTKRTPQINFDIDSQLFEISGLSFPEDAEKYYSEIEQWIDLHESFISDLKTPIIKIDLDYFNSISLKNIVRIVHDLLSINPDRFTINWYYDSDDEISYEEGIEMSEILHKKFNFIAKN